MGSPIIKIINGLADGPTTVLIGGVHGDEPSGVQAIQYLSDNLVIKTGKVVLVQANPLAVERKVRFIEYDLNRAFVEGAVLPKYEEKCVIVISDLLKQADYLLDLHNTVKNESPRFLIVEQGEIFGQFFDVDYVVSGVTKLHFGSTDEFMERNGKIGICLECGRTTNDELANKDFAIENAYRFLAALGHIDKSDIATLNRGNQTILNFKYIHKARFDFVSEKDFSDFEIIRSGDCIGYDGKDKIVASVDSHILFSENNVGPGGECFILTEVPTIL